MKALIVREFGEPDVMKLEDVETPTPSGTQVLVCIHAAGVNPVDTYLRTGIHAHAPKLPYTPGKDGAGVVEAVGEGVSKFKVGGRVYTANTVTGTYAEYAICEEIDLGRNRQSYLRSRECIGTEQPGAAISLSALTLADRGPLVISNHSR